MRKEFRRHDLGHVSVRIDDQLRVSLANLHDSDEVRTAKLAVSAVDPDLRVVSAEIRKQVEPPAPPSRPAWGTIPQRRRGAKRLSDSRIQREGLEVHREAASTARAYASA